MSIQLKPSVPVLPRIFLSLLFLCASTIWSDGVAAQVNASICGPIANHYGPFDYRTQRHLLEVVEKAHFTPTVEALIGGSTGPIGQDLDYTIRTSPNHHRALIAIVRLGEKLKTQYPKHLKYSVECYFDRALRFKADDNVVRVLYSQFLTKQERQAEAILQLERAVGYAADNPLSHFNIGLAFFGLKQYEKALMQAHKAAYLGLERPELVDMLKSVNQWKEPEN